MVVNGYLIFGVVAGVSHAEKLFGVLALLVLCSLNYLRPLFFEAFWKGFVDFVTDFVKDGELSGVVPRSTTRSLASRDGKGLQHSEPDVAALSLILTEKLSCEKSETVIVLMSLLLGITENTTSGDVLSLASFRAKDICDRLGIDEHIFLEVVGAYSEVAKRLRSWNPLAF